MNKPQPEKTLVIIKHDGIMRGLSGEILQRFEKAGLKIIGLKFFTPTRELADKHYQATDEDLLRMGNNSLRDAQEKNLDIKLEFGTDDPIEIGKFIKKWLIEYLSMGPVLIFALEGYGAIKITRKLVGATLPSEAAPGTIRGDLTHDNPELANYYKRPMKNIIHASGKPSEAEYEINLWFKPEELVNYKRVDEDALFGPISN
jgi:nucleoside-diphosphate kinase